MLGDTSRIPVTDICLGDLRCFLSKRLALRALFQMLILVLHLALHIISTSDFNLVQAFVQDLLLQSLLKLTTPSEDTRRCYVKYTYTNKIKEFLTG